MMKLVACAVLLAACVQEEETIDPTGFWNMRATWTVGNCNAAGTVAQPITVVKSGDRYLATTGVATEVTTGTVQATHELAQLDLVIDNADAKNDGGSTRARVTLSATADDELTIRGSGSVTLSGATSCSQNFALTGQLQ